MPTTKNLDNLVINKVANEDVFRSMLAQGLVGADDISFVLGWEDYDNVTIGVNAQGQLEVKTDTIPTIQAMNDAIANAIGNAIGGSY